jgi:hypothetical protein
VAPANLDDDLKKLYHGATLEPFMTKEIEDMDKKKQ